MLNARSPKEVQVPNLVGKTEEEAKTELEKLNLKYEKIGEDYNKDVEAGKIFEQKPGYSNPYKVKEKSTISVKISKGTEQTTVPKVIGMTYDEAVAELEKNKLKAEKVEETSKTIKEGIVISQEIEENTTANAGDTIKIHVSIGTGINQVAMPSVLGKTESEAKETLEGRNLKVNVEYAEDSSKDNGIVLKQSIKSGENIDEGTEVTITVNKLAETKSATITVNVKSLTGGYEEKSENLTDTVIKKKKLTIEVGGEKYFDREVDLNSTAETATIYGKGTVTVTVKIDGNVIRKADINLNTTSLYTFE